MAHAKIGSSDCDGTDAQMDAEVPRKQRLTGAVPVPFLALDDLASTMDHALILFFLTQDLLKTMFYIPAGSYFSVPFCGDLENVNPSN